MPDMTGVWVPRAQYFAEPQTDAKPWRASIIVLGSRILVTPQLIGLTPLAATAIVQALGLALGTPTYAASALYPVGIISAQSPLVNAPVLNGTAINVTVSSGPNAPVVRPNQQVKLPNLPNEILAPNVPLVDERGILNPQWWRFFLNVSQNALGTSASPPATVTVTKSPFVFSTAVQGSLIVSGGPVSLIEYSKDGKTWFPTGQPAGVFQLVPNDQVRVTYTNAPAITFFPR